ncbi:hypothetical protein PAPYR_8851 [Paratrimastix pyriformis]|uniref:Uncharacterized protein n=1 Tax=Paratrimastix pyriformis TaxID=342808 RepID=A0ABQ8U2V0_9EUKA|nr:hypothetical protein PAPYR_11932 [Paratrimastix pyriformis]KAJ4456083.1 hypothetical protein PAPYR_8851 [Paratrimastix pyriformis]
MLHHSTTFLTPSLRSQTTIHPSQAYCRPPPPSIYVQHLYKCFPSLAVMVFIKFTSNILNPNLILSRPINPSLSNSIKASNHYQLSLLLLELQQ